MQARLSHDAWLNSGNPLDEVTVFDERLHDWIEDCPVFLSDLAKREIDATVRLEVSFDEVDAE